MQTSFPPQFNHSLLSVLGAALAGAAITAETRVSIIPRRKTAYSPVAVLLTAVKRKVSNTDHNQVKAILNVRRSGSQFRQSTPKSATTTLQTTSHSQST